MKRHQPLPERSFRFRSRIIDALLAVLAGDHTRFWYIDQDSLAARCPLCGDVLYVWFAGSAPRAELVCRLGCDPHAIGEALASLRPKARA